MTPHDLEFLQVLRNSTASPGGALGERIQSLWSGYGEIRRFQTGHAEPSSYVVKHVAPPNERRHPRGWSSDVGHERKLRSYGVEHEWYAKFAAKCDSDCRVPAVRHLQKDEGRWLFVLEDLDAAGFDQRRSSPSDTEMRECLRWLANFHATFLGVDCEGLWPVGTYWHLETRPDELEVLKDARLLAAAGELDRRLNAAQHKTLVHGDAKVANFCFDPGRRRVAAVDFQYVGGGVGVKDLAYFLSSCLDEEECLRDAERWVNIYFEILSDALRRYRPDVDAGALEAEWRGLYPLAWADFMRFLLGWAPGHYKVHGYSEKMTGQALLELGV